MRSRPGWCRDGRARSCDKSGLRTFSTNRALSKYPRTLRRSGSDLDFKSLEADDVEQHARRSPDLAPKIVLVFRLRRGYRAGLLLDKSSRIFAVSVGGTRALQHRDRRLSVARRYAAGTGPVGPVGRQRMGLGAVVFRFAFPVLGHAGALCGTHRARRRCPALRLRRQKSVAVFRLARTMAAAATWRLDLRGAAHKRLSRRQQPAEPAEPLGPRRHRLAQS